jgi:hypothetical protein
LKPARSTEGIGAVLWSIPSACASEILPRSPRRVFVTSASESRCPPSHVANQLEMGQWEVGQPWSRYVPAVALEEMAMAKAKKRVAARKKSSIRGKTGAKLARKMAAKHAKPKKSKSRVQSAGMSAKKRAAMKQRPPNVVETTKIDVIDEAAPGVTAVTGYESVRTATSISPGIEPERGEGVGPAGASA